MSRSAEFESLEEAAVRVGVHPRTLRRRISTGDLPAVRLGCKILRVNPQDVDRLFHPVPTVASATVAAA